MMEGCSSPPLENFSETKCPKMRFGATKFATVKLNFFKELL